MQPQYTTPPPHSRSIFLVETPTRPTDAASWFLLLVLSLPAPPRPAGAVLSITSASAPPPSALFCSACPETARLGQARLGSTHTRCSLPMRSASAVHLSTTRRPRSFICPPTHPRHGHPITQGHPYSSSTLISIFIDHPSSFVLRPSSFVLPTFIPHPSALLHHHTYGRASTCIIRRRYCHFPCIPIFRLVSDFTLTWSSLFQCFCCHCFYFSLSLFLCRHLRFSLRRPYYHCARVTRCSQAKPATVNDCPSTAGLDPPTRSAQTSTPQHPLADQSVFRTHAWPRRCVTARDAGRMWDITMAPKES